MSTIVSLGRKTQPRIFVQKDDITYVVPYWISRKGNLCWKIEETLYVKLKSGFVMMLENGEWIPADATTKATVQSPEGEPETKTFKRFEFPTKV